MAMMILMSKKGTSEFQWWLQEENVMQGMSILPFNPTVQIFTDASTSSWRGTPSELHINMLEMLAVMKMVDISEDILANRQVLLYKGQHLGSLLHQQAGGDPLATTVSFGEILTDETT
jgi:hypothetical protein